MVKRTLSFVLALTVLASCLMGLPVMASTPEVITDITAGGAYAEKTIMSADTLFQAGNFAVSGITATRESGKTAVTFTENARYNNDITLADFSNVDLSEAMLPGKRVVSLTGTVNLSRLPEAYKLDGYKKIYENFGFGILATTSENATLRYDRFETMRVRSTDDAEKDEETGVETTNGKYNVYVGKPSAKIIADDWTVADTIELKWDFIFTDNAANNGSKDITLQVSGRKQGATEWVTCVPQQADAEAGLDAISLPVKTVPAGKNPLKKIMMSYSVNGSALTEEGASTGVTGLIAGIKESVTMTLGGFDMVMEEATEAALSDLSANVYKADDVVPFDFILPEGYKSAKISVGGVDVKTLDVAAGAYTAKLNLAAVSADGKVEVTLSGTNADDSAFTKTTSVRVPSSTFNETLLAAAPTVGGYWNDRVVMDNDTFLNRTYSLSSVTYGYDSTAKTATMSVSTSSNYKKFLDLSDLALNTESNGQVEVYLTVQPTKVSDDNWFPSAKTSSYWCLYLDSYIDGTRVQGATQSYRGLTTGYSASGVFVSFPTSSSNKTTWTETTKIPVKFVITKQNGALNMKHYVDFGKGWIDGGTETTSTAASGSLTGLGFRFGSNSKDGQIKYIISDAKVIEKAPQTARLAVYCDDESVVAGKATVDFVLPEGFESAALKIDGQEAAKFDLDSKAGAYTVEVKLSGITKQSVPVVLNGVLKNGTEFNKEVTLSIPKLGAGSLDQELFSDPTYSADKTVMDSETALNRSVTGFTYSYDASTKSATLNNGGAYQTKAKLFDFNNLRFNEAAEGSLEINMNVAVKPGSGTDYPTGASTGSAWAIFTTSPYIDGNAVNISGVERYDAGILSFASTGYAKKETPILSWSRQNYTNSVVAGNKVPLKILVTKDKTGITWTQQVKFNDTWVTYNAEKTTYTGSGKLTGMRLWIGQNTADANEYVAWEISDLTVVDNTDFIAELGDLSAGFYTQKDTGKVPVNFTLPTGYREAYVLLNGKEIAEFTSVGHLAGFYKSEIALKELGVGAHEVKLSGKMTDGTPFEKASTITVYAATEGADVYALELEEPELEAGVSGGIRSEYAKQTSVWPTYNANTNPDGPFLSQYVVELGADVDFTNGIPSIYLTGNRAQEGYNYNFGEFFNITNYGATAFTFADGSRVEIPKKKFNLTFRVIIDRPETGYGDVFNIYVYIDGQYAGLIQKTSASYSLGDLYGALSIGFRTNAADAPVSVSKLTWKKYSTISATAEPESSKKVVVTFNKDIAEISNDFITLVDKSGNSISAEVAVSGNKATILADGDIPAYASVVIGANVKEADYEFRAYTGSSESTKLRLGEALSQGFEIALNNKPTKTAVYGVTTEKDGNNIVAKVELYTLAAETIGKLVVAAYDENGVMQGIDIFDVATENEGEATLTLTAEFDGVFASYKAFLWKDVDGAMVPVLSVK